MQWRFGPRRYHLDVVTTAAVIPREKDYLRLHRLGGYVSENIVS